MFYFGKQSMEKLEGVHPTVVEFMQELIKIADDDFRIVCGVRTLEKQQEYYTWGRTVFITPWGDPVTKPVTNCDGIKHKSRHQIKSDGYSHAVDIAFLGNTQKERYDVKKFRRLRAKATPLMAKYNIYWGGDWKSFVDMPHWQLGK